MFALASRPLTPCVAGKRRGSAEVRDVAQLGSAPEWGSGGRGFESRRPDWPSPELAGRCRLGACRCVSTAISWGSTTGEGLHKHCLDRGDMTRGRRPDDLPVHGPVLVDHLVAHPHQLRPLDVRQLRFERRIRRQNGLGPLDRKGLLQSRRPNRLEQAVVRDDVHPPAKKLLEADLQPGEVEERPPPIQGDDEADVAPLVILAPSRRAENPDVPRATAAGGGSEGFRCRCGHRAASPTRRAWRRSSNSGASVGRRATSSCLALPGTAPGIGSSIRSRRWTRSTSGSPVPGGGFRALSLGQPFPFKLHHPENAIVGGGFFATYSPLPVSLAWGPARTPQRPAAPVRRAPPIRQRMCHGHVPPRVPGQQAAEDRIPQRRALSPVGRNDRVDAAFGRDAARAQRPGMAHGCDLRVVGPAAAGGRTPRRSPETPSFAVVVG